MMLRILLVGLAATVAVAAPPTYLDPIDVRVPHVSTDKSVTIDYDIVYVRAKRAGDKEHKRFYADFSQPVTMEPGADLMLLHPDGREEVLVAGGIGSVTDPYVSFDAQWVFFTLFHDLRKVDQWDPPAAGADIYKIHLKTRRVVKLTNQRFTPNRGAANWSPNYRTPIAGRSHISYGVFNMGACPLPGGRIAFTSNRDGFRPAKGFPQVALQLFVMDDRDTDLRDHEDPTNLEKIGHLNLAGALHPVVLTDGRIMYSTLESQGNRNEILWGLWTIHPDGTNWAPLVSAFDPGSAPNGFHFQTQLSNQEIVFEEYYNQNNSGFGALIKMPRVPPGPRNGFAGGGYGGSFRGLGAVEGFGETGYGPGFGPANMDDPANKPWRYGRFDNGKPKEYRMPFMPLGSVSLTPFSHGVEGPADHAVAGDKKSPSVGKFTHPCGAPDNHLLVCYSPGPVNHQYEHLPQVDGGIYLLPKGEVVSEPAGLRLIKNDPEFNECWPRPVVPYQRIYDMPRPKLLWSQANDGKRSKHLPEGTPFALVGTSSFYKRETYPNGGLVGKSKTAGYVGKDDPYKGLDPFSSHGNGLPLNWNNQGADAGLYTNEDIHAVRILVMEPTTDRKGADAGRRYHNHAGERLRILGEVALRKPDAKGVEPRDSDGNPDTSFLAKIPADVGFTFQTIDKKGMVLNMAQTWHQLRPGEIRHDCGGCHAHSQQPTQFDWTAAAKPDFKIADLSEAKPVNVEYWRDIRPILDQHCVSCHTSKGDKTPAAKLDLDADHEQIPVEHKGKFPGTYYRLAMDEEAKFGPKPPGWTSWGYPNASRYVRKFQSRRSLLVWKLFDQRLDGFKNDDHPSPPVVGEDRLEHRGAEVDLKKNRSRYDLDHSGDRMPKGAEPLSEAEKLKIVRWIDLGCPIDLDYLPSQPQRSGFGWMLDDQRPTLTLTYPKAGKNEPITRLLLGMHDYGSGLDLPSVRVESDMAIDGVAAGENLALKFQPLSPGVWEWKLSKPLTDVKAGWLFVSVHDKQGNETRIERTFTVGK